MKNQNVFARIKGFRPEKGVKLDVMLGLYAENYKKLMSGDKEVFDDCVEKGWENRNLFRGEINSREDVAYFLKQLIKVAEFPGNEKIRKHFTRKEILVRGHKFLKYYKSSTAIPYFIYQGVPTKGTGHMRCYVWWLGAMGLLEYTRSPQAYIPTELLYMHDDVNNTDCSNEAANTVRSYEAGEYTRVQRNLTQAHGSIWEGCEHPSVTKVFFACGSPVKYAIGADLENNDFHNELAKLLRDHLTEDHVALPLVPFLGAQEATARFWWGFANKVKPEDSMDDFVLTIVESFLKGEITISEEENLPIYKALFDYGVYRANPSLGEKYFKTRTAKRGINNGTDCGEEVAVALLQYANNKLESEE